jgi:hypothetical protein
MTTENNENDGEKSLRSFIVNELTIENSGIFSNERILERVSTARTTYAKRANWLHLVSAISMAYYVIKSIGLDFDLIFFENKIATSPYGIFIFCLVCQLANALALSQTASVKVYDDYVFAITKKLIPDGKGVNFLSIPNSEEYIGDQLSLIRNERAGWFTKLIYGLSFLLSSIPGIFYSLGSIAVGTHFLYLWKQQIPEGNVNIQYYSVVFALILNLSWILLTVSVILAEDD